MLQIREVDEPAAGPGQVRIRVRSTALNRADLLQRRGRYPAPPGVPPDIPGLEFAGESRGLRARRRGRPHPGDRVMGLVGGGAHAERVVVHDGSCLAVPPR